MIDTRGLIKTAITLAAGALLVACGSSGDVSAPEAWVLTLADEFDGEAGSPPNPEIWTYDIGGDGWGNQQLEYNTDDPENVSLDGEGHLRIVAREHDRSEYDNDYTSARIKTQGLFEQEHGRIEARIKLPEGAGLWPAFWMLGSNIDTVPWPGCGEIDVMEYQGQRPDRAFASIHGPGYSAAQAISRDVFLPEDETFADDFHVFSIEWDPGRITFLLDGELYQGGVIRSSDVIAKGAWVFNQDFFVLLNLAIGGTLGGPVGSATEFPAEMIVDYVRFYERPQ